MSLQKFKIVLVGENGGYSQTANGVVNVTVKTAYSELVKVIRLQQLLNVDCFVKCKVGAGTPFKLGMFKIHSTQIDGDGAAKIKFTGISDYVECNNLSSIPLTSDDDKLFKLMVEAEVEMEDDGEEMEEE
ncbi:MAG: hypothetical protein MJ168_07930 [Clostridia bacterium]|nr:hypothetical protein [Clostridia bacterium]